MSDKLKSLQLIDQKGVNTNNNKDKILCTFVSLNYTISLAGNIIVYTPIQGTNRENYFNHSNYKSKNAD